MNLDLRAPLFFKKIEEFPANISQNEEYLVCYELNPVQSRNIEPDREQLLGALVFIGKKDEKEVTTTIAATNREIPLLVAATLPAKQYFFMQSRDDHALSRDEWIDLAIENQKDGLWERNKLGNLLYVRFLHEDDSFVTQVFREVL